MLWNISFLKWGSKIPYAAASADGPSSLISDVNQEGFKVAGWNDSQLPGGTGNWIEAYRDPVTKRYKVIIEIRYHNSLSKAPKQGEMFYQMMLVYDPADPKTCLENSDIVQNLEQFNGIQHQLLKTNKS